MLCTKGPGLCGDCPARGCHVWCSNALKQQKLHHAAHIHKSVCNKKNKERARERGYVCLDSSMNHVTCVEMQRPKACACGGVGVWVWGCGWVGVILDPNPHSVRSGVWSARGGGLRDPIRHISKRPLHRP